MSANKKLKNDGFVLLFSGVVAFFLASYFDALEVFVAFSEAHEDWELDELISTTFVLVIVMLFIMIKRGKELNREIVRRESVEREISELAYLDPLTELPNRRLFMSQLKSSIEQSLRLGSQQAVLFIDIDDFKSINDTYGHAAGDSLLVELAARIGRCVSQTDMVSRIAGDEFAVLLSDVKDPDSAAWVAKNIIQGVSSPFTVSGLNISVSLSIGIAITPRDSTSSEELMSFADKAMYLVKRQGKNSYQFFSPDLNAKEIQRLEILSELKMAVDNNEMFLEYQPVYDKRFNIIQVEGLLRWVNPKLGPIQTEIFIPLAEKNGLSETLSIFVLETASQHIKSWARRGIKMPKVALNISGSDLRNSSFADSVQRILLSQNIDATIIEFEMTESAILCDIEQSMSTLKRLSSLGCSLGIDDFGVDYSSMNYLRNLPIRTLKIDKTYIDQLGTNEHSRLVFNAIVAFGNALGLSVIAEGVETEAQLTWVQNSEVSAIQGFYMSKPLHPDAAAKELLRRESKASPSS